MAGRSKWKSLTAALCAGSLACVFALSALLPSARAEDAPPPAATATPASPPIKVTAAADRRAQIYRLETVEVRGTTRLTAAQLVDELGLTAGTPLDDELVMTTRSRLLGLGVFRSAILVMRRGSKPGLAKLVIELEDDADVLTDWALGGDLAVSLAEQSAAASTDSAPLDYKVGLVGRNLFGELHRGAISLDLDHTGEIRAGQLAYGLPRFAREAAQFDAELAVVDAYWRYLDALGFGARGQGLWSRSLANLGEFQYGAAMYVNKKPRFAVPGFPDSVAGPKVAFYRETRFKGFFPRAGHLVGASALISPTDTEHSVAELDLARTYAFGDFLYLTVDARLLGVGTSGYAVRSEGRLDVPLGRAAPGEDQAAAFLRLRGGHDVTDEATLVGSAAIIGVRYHSSGFIAELALKVTRTPDQLADDTLAAPEAAHD